MVFAGTSPDGKLVEIIELRDKDWFVAVQFHRNSSQGSTEVTHYLGILLGRQ